MSSINDGTVTPAIEHEPPSLPPSPDPKKLRTADDSPIAAPSVAAIVKERETSNITPTPASHHAHAHAQTLAMAAAAEVPLEVKFLSDKACAPTRGSSLSAGYDIYSAAATTIPARGKALVETDIAIAVPLGTYGRVAPRSGLAAKHSIHCGAGVIDADYRGPLKVLLFNLSDDDFQVAQGDRIAQLILERIMTPGVVVVSELSETARGVGGFGSTGGFGVAAAPAPTVAGAVASNGTTPTA